MTSDDGNRKITVSRKHDPQTVVVHDKHDERHQGSVTVPQYQTSLFSFATHAEFDHAAAEEPDRPMYSRGNNPTVQQLEQRLAQLQGGEKARCFASGMAAISTAILAAVRTGIISYASARFTVRPASCWRIF